MNRLRVDEYDGIEEDARTRTDVVEMRANGFAVAFLAPPQAMWDVVRSEKNKSLVLSRVMEEFGISHTAASYHIRNITGFDVSAVPSADISVNVDDWKAGENLTVDYFPIAKTPISRRGLFSYLVASAAAKEFISADTAAAWLKCSIADFDFGKEQILLLNE